MNRYEKIEKIQGIKKAINEKELEIAKIKDELKQLNNDLNDISTTSVPILMFKIEEIILSQEEYEYVYYCPDLDEIIKYQDKKADKLLPNTIDMRDYFDAVGIPRKLAGERSSKYSEDIEFAVSLLKIMIDSLFSIHDIESWDDFVLYLKEIPENYELLENKKTLKKKRK